MWLKKQRRIVPKVNLSPKFIYFEIEYEISNFFTGENLIWSADGKHFYCQNENQISIVSVASGKSIDRIDFKTDSKQANDTEIDSLITFDMSADNQFIITAHKSGLLKLWEVTKKNLIKKWKSNHFGPITKLLFGTCSHIVCSVGSDSKICVWNNESRCSVTQLEGHGTISMISFHPKSSQSIIYAAGDDYAINCWNYLSKKRISTLRGHLSRITAIAFEERNFLLMASVSVDKVLILWQLSTYLQSKVIPLYEPLHGVFFSCGNFSFLPDTGTHDKDERIFAITASAAGNINLINCTNSIVMHSLRSNVASSFKSKDLLDPTVMKLLHCKKTNQFALVTVDCKILLYDTSTFDLLNQLVGYNDEILDMCLLGEKFQFLAIAANSNSIKIYSTFDVNCVVATKHTDVVLTLSGFKNFLLSAGKDHKICIWKLNPELLSLDCIQQCLGHTSPIGSISLAFDCFSMFASVSQDGCMKLWMSSHLKNNILPQNENPIFKLNNSIKAHDKEINCVTFSPNNNILATASQDKNIKIWNYKDFSFLGTLHGHQRGVWTVRFSPIDQILLSTSSDCSIRLWSLATLSCLRKMENLCSILRIEFLSKGKQFISAAVDGTIKVWNVKSVDCLSTLDSHSDRVWALAVSPENTCFYSGGADSKIFCWKDVTEMKVKEEEKVKHELNKSKEMLGFLIKENFLARNICFVLSLNKPFISYKVICDFIKHRNAFTDVFEQNFSSNDVTNLQNNMKAWNTNRRHCIASQIILFYVINKVILRQSDIFNSSEQIVKEINCYTKRHYKRTSLYLKELHFLEFTVKCM